MLLDDTPEQVEFARSLRGICSSHAAGEGEEHHRDWDPALWRKLADAGVWSLLADGGTVGDVACAAEALGAEGLAGPIAATFLASVVLPAEELEAIAAGVSIVTLADDDSIVPFGPVADVFLHVAGSTVRRATLSSGRAEVVTLAREPWERATVIAGSELEGGARGVAVAHVAVAASLIGAGGAILREAVAYTQDRRQFDRPIYSFQSVAHRLAHASSELHVAANLVAGAVAWLDAADVDQAIAAAAAAAARLLATEVCLATAFTAHQVNGGMGFVDGTMLAVLSRRSQQAAMLPPSPRALEEQVVSLPGLEHRRLS